MVMLFCELQDICSVWWWDKGGTISIWWWDWWERGYFLFIFQLTWAVRHYESPRGSVKSKTRLLQIILVVGELLSIAKLVRWHSPLMKKRVACFSGQALPRHTEKHQRKLQKCPDQRLKVYLLVSLDKFGFRTTKELFQLYSRHEQARHFGVWHYLIQRNLPKQSMHLLGCMVSLS